MSTKPMMTIDGRKCQIYEHGDGGPVVYCAMSLREGDEAERLASSINALVAETSYTLFVFETAAWADDCTPWAADANDTHFGGKGEETLWWLQNRAFPTVDETVGASNTRYLAGYSLAGLFALWALFVTDAFAGAASCSGSLWFPGWAEFAAEHSVMKKQSRVYLSLGGKEAKTANPLIATVEEKTKAELARLINDKNVVQAVLEMNPGGHFSKPEERTAKGIAWLLQRKSGAPACGLMQLSHGK